MNITTAEFVTSSTAISDCPKPDKPEFAFIGRSNVGKSSLINMLCGRKKLAKISGTPGKTQTINHFLINEEWYLVDLPGYGYAKRSKTERAKWKKFISGYLKKRTNLMCTFVLLDCRHVPQNNDLEFMEWMGENELPFVMVFTKIDKLTSTELKKNVETYKKEMLKKWKDLPQLFCTSSTNKMGTSEILQLINSTITLFSK